jgi:hypothetical protein
MNASEKQLKKFLKHLSDGQFKFKISLHPQGDQTTISKKAKNLCVVIVNNEVNYYFGGIKEKTYDKIIANWYNLKKYYEEG